MSYDARQIANQFLHLATNHRRVLTNTKLQKLVYIAHGYHLAIFRAPLTKQPIEAGRFGPVIPDLYHALRQYGAGTVDHAIPLRRQPETISPNTQALIATVEDAYKNFSGPQLATITHQDGTPWKAIYADSEHQETIPDLLIETYYATLLSRQTAT